MKLSVVEVERDTITELRSKRNDLLRALIVPSAVMTIWGYLISRIELANIPAERAFLWLTLSIVVLAPSSVVFAVSCHRIVLLGSDSLPSRFGMFWSGRELRFMLRSILIGLTQFLAVPVVSVVSLPVDFAIPWPSHRHEVDFWILTVLVIPASSYIASRLSLTLPATAVGRPMTFEQSWELTRGNGWRLTAALAIPGLVLAGLSHLSSFVVDPIHGVLSWIVVALSFSLLGAVEIAVLSVAFRRFEPLLDGPAVWSPLPVQSAQ